MDIRRWVLNDLEHQTFQYKITAGLVPKQRWSERPHEGANSVAFLVWHIARWHDIAVNVVLRGAPPVLDADWTARLGVGVAPGTAFTSDDVDRLGEAIDPAELEAYWQAVFDHTTEWITGVDDQELDDLLEAVPDLDARFAAAGDILSDAGGWVADFLRGSRGARFLAWTALSHGYWHLGELQTVTTALGFPVA